MDGDQKKRLPTKGGTNLFLKKLWKSHLLLRDKQERLKMKSGIKKFKCTP